MHNPRQKRRQRDDAPSSKKQAPVQHTRHNKKRARDAADSLVTDAWSDVLKLGKTGLANWQQRDMEADRAAALGVRREKNQSVPLPILLGKNKKRRERAAAADMYGRKASNSATPMLEPLNVLQRCCACAIML